MRIAICCADPMECEGILSVLRCDCAGLPHGCVFQVFHSREEFALAHGKEPFSIVLSAFGGAAGQETVVQALALNQECRVIWISNDRMFAFQAYRTGIVDFLVKPVEPDRLCQSFQKCFAVETNQKINKESERRNQSCLE